MPVPVSRVTLKLAKQDVNNLPDGAGYSGKSGQANLKTEIAGDSIFIYATCDSLQQRIEYYESELEKICYETEMHRKTIKKNMVQVAAVCYGSGFLTGITLILLIKLKKKNNGTN